MNTNGKKTICLDAHRVEDLRHAAHILSCGGIVALPTETVYGLAANGLSKEAITKVFFAKNRPITNPLILHVRDQERAMALFDETLYRPRVKERFDRLSRSFWPGPLTIICRKAAHIPNEAVGNLDTAAVRVANHRAMRTILDLIDFPLAMPSANLSSRPSPTSKEHVLRTLDGRIDAVVDGGPCVVGIESTVVKIDSDHVTLLRRGAIHKAMLSDALEEEVLEPIARDEEKPMSPGQAFLHYSPRVDSVQLIDKRQAADHWHGSCTIILQENDFGKLNQVHGPRASDALSIVLPNEAKQFAQELYHALYKSELLPDRKLVIVLPHHQSDEWLAILDRLTRAATAATL